MKTGYYIVIMQHPVVIMVIVPYSFTDASINVSICIFYIRSHM